MTNQEKTGLFFTSLLAIFSFVFIYSMTPSVNREAILAKVESSIPIGTPTPLSVSDNVLILRADNEDFVQLEKITGNILPAQQCEDSEFIDRYGGISQYKSRLNKDAMCATGYMEGTVLKIKIANANSSIATITDLIDLLTRTLENLNKKGTLDGMLIIAISAGGEIKTTIENSNKISVMCIENNGIKEKGKKVGKYSPVPDILFISQTVEQKNSFRVIKSGIKELNQKVAKSSVNIEDADTKDLLMKALEIAKKFKSDFLPIDATLLSDRRNMNTDTLGLLVTLGKNNGKPLMENLPKGMETLIKTVTWFIPGIPVIKGPYYVSKININVGDQNIEKSNILVPEPVIFADIKKTIENKITELSEAKKKFEKNLNTAQLALNKLTAESYYCAVSP